MHEEDDAEEEHGHAAADLSDGGEVLQIRTRDGFIQGSLHRNRETVSRRFGIDNHNGGEY